MRALRFIAMCAAGGVLAADAVAFTIPPAIVTVLPIEAHAAEVLHEEVILAAVEPEPPPKAGKTTIKEKIKNHAGKYGVSELLMQELVSCETADTFDPSIQSHAVYAMARQGIAKGEQERSFGLAQIHLPDNPEVSLEEATDPDFALDFMARELAAGNSWRWKTCLLTIGQR